MPRGLHRHLCRQLQQKPSAFKDAMTITEIVQIWPTRLIKGPCMEQELEAMLFVTPRMPNIPPKVYRT